MLDASPKLFSLYSERGFLTITGCYKTVPVSIVSIGMGAPNADFFMREVRECVRGDMLVIRSDGLDRDHPTCYQTNGLHSKAGFMWLLDRPSRGFTRPANIKRRLHPQCGLRFRFR